MKKMKRFFALFLAMAMVLGMSMTTFAAGEGTTPSKDDATKAVVTNVEAGVNVTAYRIVEPTYNPKGFTGYKVAAGVPVKNGLEPTSTEITDIAADISAPEDQVKEYVKNLTSKPLTYANGDYSANLEAGYWVVIVTGSDSQKVYNPMLIGVYYSVGGSDNTLVGGSVDANDDWSLDSTPAYAKSELPTIDKKIVGGEGENHSDVAIGDTVNFEIDTVIPAYSASYTKVDVQISDRLSAGLTLKDAPTVTVGGTPVTASDATYTYTPDGNSGFTIKFASAYALLNNGKAVVVTYSAEVSEDAGLNFDANTNTASLSYTNDPATVTNTNKINDKTYTYTFAIGANLFGSSKEEWNKITQELLKTGEVREITNESGEIEETNTLPGAEFTLTKGDKVVGTATSGEDGSLTFTGLDVGNYILQETSAPEGYTLNEQKIPVNISAEYNPDGTLKNYTITIDGEVSFTYEATYNKETVVTNIEETLTRDPETQEEIDSYEILNTKLSSLPSTGGIGTTIFTVGGCAIMILAAGMFFVSRRKASR